MTDRPEPGNFPEPVPASAEPAQKAPENIINLESYHAVYGRLLIAQGGNPEAARELMNPAKQIEESNLQGLNLENRNYDPVVSGLSMDERSRAWEDVIRDHDFNEAKKQWREGLRASINLRSEQKDLVVKHFFEVNDISEISDEENGVIDKLYDKYCKGGSDITYFVNKALENPDLDSSEVEWLAKKLFGKVSAKVTLRILELESGLRSDRPMIIQSLFYKNGNELNRINRPTPEEDEILRLLTGPFEKPKTDTAPKPKGPQSSSDQFKPLHLNLKTGLKLTRRSDGKEFEVAEIYNPSAGAGAAAEDIGDWNRIKLTNPDGDEVISEPELFSQYSRGEFVIVEEVQSAQPVISDEDMPAPLSSPQTPDNPPPAPTIPATEPVADSTHQEDPEPAIPLFLRRKSQPPSAPEPATQPPVTSVQTASTATRQEESHPEPDEKPEPTPLELLEEKRDNIAYAIEIARRGGTPVDPDTNLPMALTGEEAIKSLEDKLSDTRVQIDGLRSEKNTKQDDSNRQNGDSNNQPT